MFRGTFSETPLVELLVDRLRKIVCFSLRRMKVNAPPINCRSTRVVPTQSLESGYLKYLCTPDPSIDPNCTTSNPNVSSVVDGGAAFQGFNIVTLSPANITSLDQGCSANGVCPPTPGNSVGPGPNGNLANIGGANANALFAGYPVPNSTSGGGDGLNSAAFTFPGNDPTSLNTYIVKLDYKITADGNHSLFIRGNLQNDHERQPPQFPGLPANNFVTNNSKGIAGGYTWIVRNNLINNFRYAFIRQGLGNSGLDSQPFNRLRGLDDVVGLTPTILTNVPVHNFIDDVSWTKGHHTIQFGTNWRLIHNNRQSNAQNLSEGYANLYWMSPSFIAGKGASLDPARSVRRIPL